MSIISQKKKTSSFKDSCRETTITGNTNDANTHEQENGTAKVSI